MRNSISNRASKVSKAKTLCRDSNLKPFRLPASLLIWFIIWHTASLLIGQEMLLASPVSVAKTLYALAGTYKFWSSIAFSVSRIVIGFSAALLLGVAFACAAYKLKAVEIFLKPPMGVLKAAPVASYIILCLIYMPSSRLSAAIAFTMALPIVYTNVLSGLKSVDTRLIDMAEIYEIGFLKRAVYIYFPEILPFMVSACALALGMSWKAGVAAEVIGLPLGSIGEKLYMAKIFVDTKSVLAWTAVVVMVSWLFEKFILTLLSKLASRLERL